MRKRKTVMSEKIFAVLMCVMMGAVLFGCGSSGSTSKSSDYYAEEEYGAGATAMADSAYESNALYDSKAYDGDYEEAYEDVAAPEAPSEPAKAETPADTSRKLITTMYISAETENMDELLARVDSKVTGLGGYIESSDIQNGSYRTYSDKKRSYRNANLTIRIPAAALAGFISDFQEHSNITSQSKNVEDVTLTYADLESHKKMLKAEEKRLLEFMEQAETVEDMITVEERLTDVQYQIDSMESQLRTYDNKINYSTVHLSIEEVIEYTVIEEEVEKTMWQEIKEGFADNLDSVIEGLKDFFVWFVIHIPQLIIWAIVIAVIVKIIAVFRARGRKKRAEAAAAGYGKPLSAREQEKLRRQNEKEARRAAKKATKLAASAQQSANAQSMGQPGAGVIPEAGQQTAPDAVHNDGNKGV
ncbi:MAG: DUF4349 domain-containing protein [Lachnospiraceae bacterium]|nr:DUF4349 domain-containing protein [Lachnospiraceae bacterium]